MNTSAYVHAESTQEFLFRNALERIRDLEEIMNSNKKVIALLEEEKAMYKKKD